jgi:hypothetical protein
MKASFRVTAATCSPMLFGSVQAVDVVFRNGFDAGCQIHAESRARNTRPHARRRRAAGLADAAGHVSLRPQRSTAGIDDAPRKLPGWLYSQRLRQMAFPMEAAVRP